MSEQDEERRLPGRIVLVAYGCLVVWGVCGIVRLNELSALAGWLVLPLLLGAIVTRLDQNSRMKK